MAMMAFCGMAKASGNCTIRATCNEIFSLSLNESQVVMVPAGPGESVNGSSLVSKVQCNKVNADGSLFPWNLAVKADGNLAGSGSLSIPVENLRYACALSPKAETDDVQSQSSYTTVSYSDPGLGTPVMWGTRSLGSDGSGVAATSSFSLTLPKSTMAGDYSCVLTYTLF